MTIDEAIKHCEKVAEKNEKKAEYRPRMDYYDEIESRTDCLECAADHRQLAKWLTELKEAKRLLKEAVPIINNMFPEVGSCWGCANHDETNDRCKAGAFEECAEVCKWKHTDEAEKLIRGED